MKIAICDNEKSFRESFCKTLMSSEFFAPGTSVSQFSSGDALIEYYTKFGGFDIVFLDMEMPGLTGIETGQAIRNIDDDVIIVFVTNFSQYAIPSIKIEIFDYIIKPVTADIIDNVLKRAVKKYQELRYIVKITSGGVLHALEAKKIVYIESYRGYVTFFTENKEYKCSGNLTEYAKTLEQYGFLRCHQGFLINMKYIKSIESNLILTTTGAEVEMSVRKKKECLKKFGEYIARYRI